MKILEGIRVVDFTLLHNGPSAAVKLAEMGAEVIKVERPVLGDESRGYELMYGVPTTLSCGRNWFFEFLNYGKKGIAIDLKTEKGREAIHRLIARSDVFLTNYRPRVAKNLGLDYETLRSVNPKLIYASSSCLGDKGPLGNVGGNEFIAQAKSGINWLMGDGEEPQLIHSSVGDQAGSILTAFGIVSALLARERFGIGQEVTTSQLGGLALLEIVTVMGRIFSGHDQVMTKRTEARAPLFNHYRCKDGRWLVLGMIRADYWEPFCGTIGRPEWIEDPRFVDIERRTANRGELIRLLDELFASATAAEWEQRLRETDLLCSIIETVSDLTQNPDVFVNGYLPMVEHPDIGPTRWLMTPIRFSETPLAFGGPAPLLGQHTEEVLVDICGYSWDEIARLQDASAV